MKKLFLITVVFFLFSTPSFSSVSTSDGALVIDFHEDTPFNIDTGWSLEIHNTELVYYFEYQLVFRNTAFNFDNEYISQTLAPDFWAEVTYEEISDSIKYSKISMAQPAMLNDPDDYDGPLIPTGWFVYSGLFTGLPTGEGYTIIDEFEIDITYTINLENTYSETLTLTGPVGFAPVPEPMSMALFVFGAFILKKCIRN